MSQRDQHGGNRSGEGGGPRGPRGPGDQRRRGPAWESGKPEKPRPRVQPRAQAFEDAPTHSSDSHGSRDARGDGLSGSGSPSPSASRGSSPRRPPLTIFTTTLWEYPSQHYDSPHVGQLAPRGSARAMQGDKNYIGATPSWVIWQLLQRYTREGDIVVDPMAGSGTTLDVCRDLNRKGIGFDVSPQALAARPELRRADARKLPLPDASADFVFVDPPYSTHVDYSDDPACIGILDALSDDGGRAYYDAMGKAIREMARVLKPRRYMGLYVSDSFKKDKGIDGGKFAPIGFRLFGMLAEHLTPVDIIAVVRHNQKLSRGNWKKAAEEGNFFLRGFNYLFIFKKK